MSTRPEPHERIGHWMQTFTGRAFYPLDPRPEDVAIEDIAHALARVCRFGGHVRGDWYSVAQHSVLVSEVVADLGGRPSEVFAGLMHDAAEAYVGDVVWPLKHATGMDGYRAIETRVEQVVAEAFGLLCPLPAIVKHADLVLLATEKRDIVNGSARTVGHEVEAARAKLGAWHCDDVAPMADEIVGLSPAKAEALFLAAFERCRGQVRR